MFNKFMYQLIISATITGASITSSYAGGSCMPIGGTGMPNFVPQKDGTITIVAPLTGSVANAAGKITAQRKTATGLEMDMEHYFMQKRAASCTLKIWVFLPQSKVNKINT